MTRRLPAAAVLVAAVIAEIGGFALPLTVGTLARSFSVAPGAVGFLISAQIGMFSLAALGAAPFVDRLDRRLVALVGVALILAGNLASAATESFATLIALRAVVGLGEGLTMAMMTAAAAEAASPEAVFARSWLLIVLMSIAVSIGIPLALLQGGGSAAFLAMAIATAVLGPFLFAFPQRVGTAASRAPRADLGSPATLRIGGATALFAISINGAWAFIEQIGRANGLDVRETGYAILFASVVALAAPLLTLWLKDRVGRSLPIATMLALAAAGVMATTHAGGAVGFVGGLTLSSFCLVFGMPYLLGLAAATDPTGRVATAVRAFGALGNTLTPSISGGLLLGGLGHGAIGWTAVGCSIVAALLVLPVARRSDGVAPARALSDPA